jgi:tRNA pseudouridine32 synthase / 23S rRNA pseudouridine746 synthase
MHSHEIIDSKGGRIGEHTPYHSGTHLHYYRELPHETVIPFQEKILYHDAHLIVVDKPHFLPVIPSGSFLQQTLLVRLKNTLGIAELVPIHRIDKDTAGLVMFSCDPKTRGAYQQLFQQRRVHKVYHAVACSRHHSDFPIVHKSRLVDAKEFFRTCEVPGLANSETHISLLENRGEYSLYELTPVTGKKHQLRVHMAALGLPLLNDVLYPEVSSVKEDDFSQPLQLLAKEVRFVDPVTKEQRYFCSEQFL